MVHHEMLDSNRLALALVGVALMPASGFWLLLPPVCAILLRKPRPLALS